MQCDYEILVPKSRHVEQVESLISAELGDGFMTAADIYNIVGDMDSYICRVAADRGNIVGFCYCVIMSGQELSNYLRLDKSTLPQYVAATDTVGIIKTISVAGDYQGHGIGSKLLNVVYDELTDCGVRVFCSVAWKSNGHTNSAKLLQSIGLEPFTEIKSYWEADSIEKQYCCPVCGPPPCKCSMVLYLRM